MRTVKRTKRILTLILALMLLLSLSACGEKEEPTEGNTEEKQESEKNPTAPGAAQKPGKEEPSVTEPEPPAPAPFEPTPEPEPPMGVTIEVVETTLYVRGRGPMEDYTSGPSWGQNIMEIVVEEGITHIGDYAFVNVKKVQEVTLPETLETIGKYAFEKMPIQEIDLPSNLTEIGYGAFRACLNLKEISGGENLTMIDSSTFSGVPYVKNNTDEAFIMGHCYLKYRGSESEVIIPEGITYIGSEAFLDNKTLTSVVLPESLLKIDTDAFYCSGLTSVYIPDAVHALGARAFANTQLQTVTGGSGLMSVGNKAFESTAWEYQNQGDFLIVGSALLKYKGSAADVTVPEGVKVIATGAFQLDKRVNTVYLPDGIMRIGVQAFHQCNVILIDMPATLEVIEAGAFDGGKAKVIRFRGTEAQWNVKDAMGNAYSIPKSLSVEYLK